MSDTTAVSHIASSTTEPTTSFAELGVPHILVAALAADGKSTAFPIQVDTIPDALAGRDILGRGKTGSGKTLAFTIPLITRLSTQSPAAMDREIQDYEHELIRHGGKDDARRGKGRNNRGGGRSRGPLPSPRALVLAPTRELANQINEVIEPLAATCRLSTTTIYGGVRQNRQVDALRAGADIVVACPGRLEDLLRQRLLTLENVEITVLDEADEMADMGFLPAVERLLDQVSADGQRMLFSATLDHGVDALVNRFLHDPKVHTVDSATAHVTQMTHHIFETTLAQKHQLVRVLASGSGKRILFTRTKHQAKKLAQNLTDNGIPAAELHGNLSQNQRDRNLSAFSEGDVRVLVATDVAARGVDVSGVELVVQVDPPADAKSFLHRSGRTARAGHEGDVVTLVLPDQRRDVRRLLRIAGIEAKAVSVTSDSPAVEKLVGNHAPLISGWTLPESRPARQGRGGHGSRGSQGSRSRGSRTQGSRSRDARFDGPRPERTRSSKASDSRRRTDKQSSANASGSKHGYRHSRGHGGKAPFRTAGR
ncbi:superfamily II DNA/RNA helicase [Bifidobacterium psychraerophilum DSM 22366]|uniref:ATP-dependent RNA helicase n=1 Tax=Bifidobacterium psychraerophilum TaxID=218140 RepID=A0A087CJD2_9BIFI|nr:ATP-dependent RNA helicase [Bifidobacterium psychraerophilum]PKA94431.1 superfamily II DNA/RNA helicase [Bifidobacterium psychraerophilum DSM 22366]